MIGRFVRLKIQNLVTKTSRRLPLWRAVNVIYRQSTTPPGVGIHSTWWGVYRAMGTDETYSPITTSRVRTVRYTRQCTGWHFV